MNDKRYQWIDLAGYEEATEVILEHYDTSGKKEIFTGTLFREDHLEEDLLKNHRPDKDITKIAIRDEIHRGVTDWGEFSRMIRRYYPNVRYVYVDQNYGDDDFRDCKFDVIVINDSQTQLRDLTMNDLVYRKVFEFNLMYGDVDRSYTYVFEKHGKVIVYARCRPFDEDKN